MRRILRGGRDRGHDERGHERAWVRVAAFVLSTLLVSPATTEIVLRALGQPAAPPASHATLPDNSRDALLERGAPRRIDPDDDTPVRVSFDSDNPESEHDTALEALSDTAPDDSSGASVSEARTTPRPLVVVWLESVRHRVENKHAPANGPGVARLTPPGRAPPLFSA